VSCLDQTQVYVRPLLVPPEPVTVTCTSPAAWAGAMAVVCVDESIPEGRRGAAAPYGQRTGESRTGDRDAGAARSGARNRRRTPTPDRERLSWSRW
jgi:hypothetical protein